MPPKFSAALVLLAAAAAAAQAVPPESLFSLTFKAEFRDAESCQDTGNGGKPVCHTAHTAYPVTGDRYLDAWVKREMGGRLPTRQSAQAAFDADRRVKAARRANRTLGAGGKPCVLRYTDRLSLDGYTPRYAVFEKDQHQSFCGGSYRFRHFFIVLPRGVPDPKPLTQADIVLPGRMAALVARQKEAYIGFLQKYRNMGEEEARRYAGRYNPRSPKDLGSWYFSNNYLVFRIRQDEAGSSPSLDSPRLFIHTRELQGIIRPEILEEAARLTWPDLRY